MDEETRAMVRLNGNGLDRALKVSLVVCAFSVALAALAVTWSASVRVAPGSPAAWPTVYRENVWTGRGEFCGVGQDGAFRCIRGEVG